jgi:hypothetical protein
METVNYSTNTQQVSQSQQIPARRKDQADEISSVFIRSKLKFEAVLNKSKSRIRFFDVY